MVSMDPHCKLEYPLHFETQRATYISRRGYEEQFVKRSPSTSGPSNTAHTRSSVSRRLYDGTTASSRESFHWCYDFMVRNLRGRRTLEVPTIQFNIRQVSHPTRQRERETDRDRQRQADRQRFVRSSLEIGKNHLL